MNIPGWWLMINTGWDMRQTILHFIHPQEHRADFMISKRSDYCYYFITQNARRVKKIKER